MAARIAVTCYMLCLASATQVQSRSHSCPPLSRYACSSSLDDKTVVLLLLVKSPAVVAGGIVSTGGGLGTGLLGKNLDGILAMKVLVVLLANEVPGPVPLGPRRPPKKIVFSFTLSMVSK